MDKNVAGQQFRLIYTQDVYDPQKYKLTSSNPGQFFYNVFYTEAGPDHAVTFTLTIPFPFVTQGATPVHVYSTVTIATGPDGQTCLIPGQEIWNAKEYITLGRDTYQKMGDTTTITVIVPADAVPDSGTLYLNLHLDYGLKSVHGWAKKAKTSGCPVPPGSNALPTDADDADNGTGVIICNFQQYTFTYSAVDGAGTQSDSATVMSENVFKNDPGIAGLVMEADGTPIPDVKVEIYQGTTLMARLTTDEHGFYMWTYKYSGKPTPFTVKLPDLGMQVSFIFKSKGFAIVNFYLEGPGGTPPARTEVFAKWL